MLYSGLFNLTVNLNNGVVKEMAIESEYQAAVSSAVKKRKSINTHFYLVVTSRSILIYSLDASESTCLDSANKPTYSTAHISEMYTDTHIHTHTFNNARRDD